MLSMQQIYMHTMTAFSASSCSALLIYTPTDLVSRLIQHVLSAANLDAQTDLVSRPVRHEQISVERVA